ncbi:ABC transporter substrate-binding protein [Paenibacillus radicis (ex Xue et al. 2023)]|uniref:Extracellular solute-binding protein n=1 Tax=Paenibacillus radicis (ex Xue et al. 2023) TaxID=2972489 RepID=A0ABT1YAJ7_9BACL|nr:extracellular solute-binding protein [Paenibacillus radicis (ex Xue et al. 2023)]MCR8630212.1 extracellular solute-binding protein [Paenibacillus radicis (ex Xue et al. 2023)]
MKKVIRKSCLIGSVLLVLAGCFDGTNTESIRTTEGTPPSETVAQTPDKELFIFTAWPSYFAKEEIFEQQIGQFIKKKFPDIKLKHVAWDSPGKRYEDLIALGTIPDIVFDDVRRNTYRQVRRFKMEYDMTDLIKKYNFDTSKLNSADMQHSINSSDGKLYSLPYNSNEYILVYNKDMFDKLDVAYPKDGMTWDDAYEIAKKLTLQEGDIPYRGFQMNPAIYLRFNQLSEPGLDPNENQASMVSDRWVKIVDNLRRFYEIPGNPLVNPNEFARGQVAMIIDSMENVTKFVAANKNLNFDFASVPIFPEAPKSKFQPNNYGMFITNQSNKKDLAFQVISYLLSPEVQLEIAKQGVMVPRRDAAVQQAFGQAVPQWQGKHIQSLFALNSAKPPSRKPGLTFINEDTYFMWRLISTDPIDTLAALRKTNESMNKGIEETIKIQQEGGISDYE